MPEARRPEPEALPESRAVLATTFRPDEVQAACVIFSKISIGEDVRMIARSAAVQSLHAKFVKLREKSRGG